MNMDFVGNISTGSSGEGRSDTLTLDDVERMVRDAAALPKNDQWILINPQGQAYSGTVDQILPVLMAEHSLVKQFQTFNPLPFDYKGA